jgi:glyoxylase-like metal-dependent hydrolase (beta-lactamase superfamily II)
MRKFFKVSAIVFAIVILAAVVLFIMYYPTAKKLFFYQKTVQLSNAATVYFGGGGNSLIYNTDSVVIVVDTKYGKAAQRLFEEVTALAAGRPIIVINTHSDSDHTGGNPLYDNYTIISGKVDENYWLLGNQKKGMPDVWITDTMDLVFKTDTVTLIPVGQAHTWSDIVILFRKEHLLVTGDLIFNKINVFFSEEKGSDGRKSIEVLKKLKDIKGYQTVLPGHSDMGGPEIIDMMLEYFTDMEDAARNPEKEKEVIKKYADWAKMPGVTSPKIIIDYFRKHP